MIDAGTVLFGTVLFNNWRPALFMLKNKIQSVLDMIVKYGVEVFPNPTGEILNTGINDLLKKKIIALIIKHRMF